MTELLYVDAEAGLAGTVAGAKDRLLGPRPALVISDGTIAAAEGLVLERIAEALGRTTRLLVLPGEPPPKADDSLVELLRLALEPGGFTAIAFGAGTINDAAKRASFELGRPYLCVPTAPSVDGFSSSGAAITVAGFKSTLPCPPPVAIAVDGAMIARAPAMLIAAGFGDMAAKLSADVDWAIADAVGAERVDSAVRTMVRPLALLVFVMAEKIGAREPGSVLDLFKGLAASGSAMALYGDSRPASGAEHLVSHALDMDPAWQARGGAPHGFQTGLSAVAMAAVQRAILEPGFGASGRSSWPTAAELKEARLRALEAALPDGQAKLKARQAVLAKSPDDANLDARRRACIAWRGSSAASEARSIDPARIRVALAAAGCPSTGKELGLERAIFRRAFAAAALIRTRYTALDLAWELGMSREAGEIAVAAAYRDERGEA